MASESELSLARLEAKRKFAARASKRTAAEQAERSRNLLPAKLAPREAHDEDGSAGAAEMSPAAVAPLLNIGTEDSSRLWAVLLLGLCVSIYAPQLDVLSSVPTITWPYTPSPTPNVSQLDAPTPLGLVPWDVEPSTGAAVAMFCLVFIAWAIWEAVKFPRHFAASSSFEIMRTIAQFWGDLIVAPVYSALPPEVPVVQCQDTDENARILQGCPSLGSFKQSSLLRNSNLAFGALLFRDFCGNNPKLVRREHVRAKDGGIVALDWWVETEVPEGSKILFVGSTFTGDGLGAVTRDLCRYFSSRGWRCVTMVKRGCGLTMPNVQPAGTKGSFCWGGLPDTELAVDHVTDKYPGADVCGLGLSLGGGQLRNYVNATGAACKLRACVVVDAADCFVNSCESLDRRLPHIGGILFKTAAGALEHCGHAPLAESPGGRRFSGMRELVREGLAPLNGFGRSDAAAEEYLRACKPKPATGCRRPLLEMCTFNDMLIDVETVTKLQGVYRESPHVITCSTRSGTHIIRWEGFRGTCWLSRVSHEFLDTALKTPRPI